MARTKSQPTPPFPPQHQPKPGIESELRPRPKYKAPEYRGSDKLRGCAALITGGDSGIGRAVAVLFAREGADVAIVYLPVEESDAKTTEKAVEERGTAGAADPRRRPGFGVLRRGGRTYGHDVRQARYPRQQCRLSTAPEVNRGHLPTNSSIARSARTSTVTST